jgi:hypothetical protein
MVIKNVEQHRHECEVKWLATFPLQSRRDYLQLVEVKRNKQAREQLEQGLITLWNNRR